MAHSIRVRIKRSRPPGQVAPTPPVSPYEEFDVPESPGLNVISCLMAIRKNPVTVGGLRTSPPVWEASCLEEVCGSCTMVINGKVRQACSTLIKNLEQPVTLEPMTKFPVVRDLMVDRQSMFESLKRVKAWIPLDGTHDLGPGPRMSAELQEARYILSTCMTCGCCLEACPQVNEHSDFIGAAAISQVRLFNLHPTGKLNAADRVHGLMEKGGVQDCGKAQNCVEVCPKKIPLTSSIAEMGREALVQGFKDMLFRDHGTGSAEE